MIKNIAKILDAILTTAALFIFPIGLGGWLANIDKVGTTPMGIICAICTGLLFILVAIVIFKDMEGSK